MVQQEIENNKKKKKPEFPFEKEPVDKDGGKKRNPSYNGYALGLAIIIMASMAMVLWLMEGPYKHSDIYSIISRLKQAKESEDHDSMQDIEMEKDIDNLLQTRILTQDDIELLHYQQEPREDIEPLLYKEDPRGDIGQNHRVDIGQNHREDIGQNHRVDIGQNHRVDMGRILFKWDPREPDITASTPSAPSSGPFSKEVMGSGDLNADSWFRKVIFKRSIEDDEENEVNDDQGHGDSDTTSKVNDAGDCGYPPLVQDGVMVLSDSTQGYVECDRGFTSTSGKVETHFTCFQGRWKFDLLPEGQVMECVSNQPCNGVSLAEVDNMDIINISGISGWCREGHYFPSGDSSSFYFCQEGTWKLPVIQQEGCQPFCKESCLNGGSCIAPDTCECPDGYMGDTCDVTQRSENEEEGNSLLIGRGLNHGKHTKREVPKIPDFNDDGVSFHGDRIMIQGVSGAPSITLPLEETNQWEVEYDSIGEDNNKVSPSMELTVPFERSTTNNDFLSPDETLLNTLTTIEEIKFEENISDGSTTSSSTTFGSSDKEEGSITDQSTTPLSRPNTAAVVPSTTHSSRNTSSGKEEGSITDQSTTPLSRPNTVVVVPSTTHSSRSTSSDKEESSITDQSTTPLSSPNTVAVVPSTTHSSRTTREKTNVCDPLPIIIYNAGITISHLSPVATCNPGFVFSGGETTLEFKCEDGKWLIPEPYINQTEVICEAVCEPPCQNEGKCIEPNLCRCPKDFTGKSCKVVRCLTAPPSVKNAEMEYDPVITKGICLEGYQLSSGNKSINIECIEGAWVPDFCEDEKEVEPPKLECEPVCREDCKNGGTCVAPGSCACPMPYDGRICEAIRENICQDSPPIVGKAMMNYTNTMGIAECVPGYAFNTGEVSIRFLCNFGEWKFPKAALQTPECYPTCTGGCQNGGYCVDANQCHCVKPFTGDLCEEVATDVCPNAPSPMPHSIMHLSPRGILIDCEAGYILPSGKAQTELWCMNSRWVPALYNNPMGVPVMAEDLAEPLSCEPTCSPPCLNGGSCVDINICVCFEPYTGAQCQEMVPGRCWDKTPRFDNADIHYNSSVAVVSCKDGYALKNNDRELTLTCQDGEWVIEETKDKDSKDTNTTCVPSCVPPCDNGGDCTSPNTCSCDSGFYGNLCQKRRCDTVPSAIAYSSVTSGIVYNQAVLSCFNGYRLNTGYGRTTLECIEGKWMIVETSNQTVDSLVCWPFCIQPCLRGGTCLKPELCQCTEEYAGQYCQFDRCKDFPVNDTNSVVTFSDDLLRGSVSCQHNYGLSTGHDELEFDCLRGKWTSPVGLYMGERITCSPKCHGGCANGGICLSPNTCQCPVGYVGSSCEKRYSKTVNNENCVFPFIYNGTTCHTCTTSDSTRPWCATEITAHGHVSSYDICVANYGPKKVVVTVRGELCNFPFVYEGDKYYSCITTQKNPRPWCATEVDLADAMTKWDTCDPYYGVKDSILTITEKSCKLPFLQGGKWYYGCVEDEIDTGIYPWCATKTTYGGIPLETETCKYDWGDKKVTRTTDGKPCLFPFIWNNQEVHTCLPPMAEKREPWCAIKVNSKRKMEAWSQCIEDPDTLKTPEDLENTTLPPVIKFPMLGKNETIHGRHCVFPFKHKGITYTGCVEEDLSAPWCATEVEDMVVRSQGLCSINWDLPTKVEIITGQTVLNREVMTVKGVSCVFPFKYKGVQYFGCITVGTELPFCAIQVDQKEEATEVATCPLDWDRDQQLGDSVFRPTVITYGQTGDVSVVGVTSIEGAECQFPFIYDDIKYLRCISKGAKGPFCATKVDHKGVTLETGLCPENSVMVMPNFAEYFLDVTTESNKRCIFPFVYNKVEYYGCTNCGSVRPFCATRVDFDDHNIAKELGYCPLDWNEEKKGFDNPENRVDTRNGACEFPFVYKDVLYSGCITDGEKGSFCATKVDKDRNILEIGYCDESWKGIFGDVIITITGKRCILPYFYNGIMSYTCIVTEESDGKPVCATAVDEDDWATDMETCPPNWEEDLFIKHSDGEKCVFPFKFKGNTYNACTCEGEAKSWCATTVDRYLERVTWKYCNEDGESKQGREKQAEDSEVESFPDEGLLEKMYSQGQNSYPEGFGHRELAEMRGGGRRRPIKTERGLTCVFPFRWDNKEYKSCVEVKSGYFVCATSIDAQGQVVTADKCLKFGTGNAMRPVINLPNVDTNPKYSDHEMM